MIPKSGLLFGAALCTLGQETRWAYFTAPEPKYSMYVGRLERRVKIVVNSNNRMWLKTLWQVMPLPVQCDIKYITYMYITQQCRIQIEMYTYSYNKKT